jgi:hypothetical protein
MSRQSARGYVAVPRETNIPSVTRRMPPGGVIRMPPGVRQYQASKTAAGFSARKSPPRGLWLLYATAPAQESMHP